MVCTSLTISPVLSITNLVATPRASQPGWADITWTQNIAANIKITVDGTVVSQGGYAAGNNSATLNGLAEGNHTICVDQG